MSDTQTSSVSAYVLKPSPRPWSKRAKVIMVLLVLLFAGLWFVSFTANSEEPASQAAAAIASGRGLQVTIQATNFNQSTSILTLRLKSRSVGNLVDNRGILQQAIELRVVDDEGVTLVKYNKGDPLETDDIQFQMNGNINSYPFDRYTGDFSILVEEVGADGTLTPLPVSVGTAKAKTGYVTKYTIQPGDGTEEKVTIVSMKREPFIVAFAIGLTILMLLLAGMSMVVGVLLATHRRECSPPFIGWLVGLLFALPAVRNLMPGSPPIGCVLDVAVFSWAVVFCIIAMLLAVYAWLSQSRASLSASQPK